MTLPAGLLDHNFEFFASDDMRGYCLNHGAVTDLDALPADLIDKLDAQVQRFPEKVKGIEQMGVFGRLQVIKQFLLCNYGGFDSRPDMVDGVLQQPEFWPCPNRGKCALEGIVCDGLKTDTGEFLSKREIQVVKHIATGALDKHIAQNLNISHTTLATHTRNIRRKTSLFRKADITRFALEKQLI